MSMKTTVNGRTVEVGQGTSLHDLIASYGVRLDAVIASVNDSVVKPADWGSTAIGEGDRVELVSLVGGG